MKKGIIATILFGLVLLVAGCSTNNSNNTKTTSSKKGVTSEFYDSLNTKDKKKVKFKFDYAEDETSTSENSMYVVSMKVTNKTDKTVKFDQSKFLIFNGENSKFQSSKKGTLAVKPGQSKSIHQLFENVTGDALAGGGSEFIYLNKQNKLGDADFGLAKSDTSETKNTDSSVNSGQVNSNQNSDTSNQSSTPTEEEARQKLISRLSGPIIGDGDGAEDVRDFTAMRGSAAWSFVDSWGLAWDVFDNGFIKGPGDPEPVMPGN